MRTKETTPRGARGARVHPEAVSDALNASPLRLEVDGTSATLPPRLARRARALAFDAGRSVAQLAAAALAREVVPDVRERRRLVRLDLAGQGVRS